MAQVTILDIVAGSVPYGVEAVLAWVRALWTVHGRHCRAGAKPNEIICEREHVSDAYARELRRASLKFTAHLETELVKYMAPAGEVPVDRRHFHSVQALSLILDGVRHPADMRYFAMRSLRIGYDVRPSASNARIMQVLCAKARSMARKRCPCQFAELQTELAISLNDIPIPADSRPDVYAGLFLELCAAAGAIRPLPATGMVELDPLSIDADHLLSWLFGLPTSIPGFDDLFGGGGPLLVDTPESFMTGGLPTEGRPEDPTPQWIGARTVLTIGPFGSGKSLLSLRIAVEVARKGGLVLLVVPEQSPEECIYSLEALGINFNDPAFQVVRDQRDIFGVLAAPEPGRGALVFVPTEIESTLKEGFAKSMTERLPWLDAYSLRMLVLDPVNAFVHSSTSQPLTARAEVSRLAKNAKQRNVNVWLTCEQTHEGQIEGRFEENIADTVIRLGFLRESEERSIQVTKSRLQKEDASRHTLRIGPGDQFRVIASSATQLRYQPRLQPEKPSAISTGIPGLDDILGPGSVLSGDVILFDGPTGTAKSLLGLVFLLGYDRETDRQSTSSLLVTDFGYARMAELREIPSSLVTSKKRIELLSIEPGTTTAGQVLMDIRNRFERALDAGRRFDRVMLTNLTRWELEMPNLRADPVFLIALVSLIRKYDATSLIVTGRPDEHTVSAFRQLMIESSDCNFDFARVEFRGQERHFIRVLKTHDMLHRRSRFEITVTQAGAQVCPREPLLRFDAGGNARPVHIALFLHAETLNHERFNDTVVGALRTTVSPECEIQPQNRRYDPTVLLLGQASAVDEVQIIQLDEYQLSSSTSAGGVSSGLRHYEVPHGYLDDRIGRLAARAVTPGPGHNDQLFALPFYVNISLLAYRPSGFESGFPQSWSELVAACCEWERSHPNEDELFFGCQVAQSDRYESYNCLFFEILYSLHPFNLAADYDLRSWFTSDVPAVVRAAGYFRQLVHRSHVSLFRPALAQTSQQVPKGKDPSLAEVQQTQLETTSRAIVWRHWYNTLNQMLSNLPPDNRRDISVRALYGDENEPHSVMTTAGEWYLVVPAYSAAPETARQIMEHLASEEKELQRVHLGVGLPTRAAFYAAPRSGSALSAAISKYFDIDMNVLRDVVNNGFRRSLFRSYHLFAETISSHLVRMLELPSADLDSQIKATVESLTQTFEFIEQRSERTTQLQNAHDPPIR